MKLVASMPVRNEVTRYLPAVLDALDFCDEIRVLDDGSVDGTFEYLTGRHKVTVKRNDAVSWREHEGQFRRQLQNFTLEAEPTHVLAIDGDELIADGSGIRETLEAAERQTVFTLRMVELWALDPPTARHDGGWRPHEKPMIYRVPQKMTQEWRIHGRAMACPRVPPAVRNRTRRATSLATDVLHLGWANPAERQERYERYAELDGGKFHAGTHLRSILLPDDECDLRPYDDLRYALDGA
jgi:glycosyltransferase involved in cell wall biosynthesis